MKYLMGLLCQKNANVILFTFQIDLMGSMYIEENALSYCKLFISSLIWIRQGVSVAWPWCSRFYCLALAVSSARWEFLKLSASLIQTTLGYHKTGKCLHAFLFETYAKVY